MFHGNVPCPKGSHAVFNGIPEGVMSRNTFGGEGGLKSDYGVAIKKSFMPGRIMVNLIPYRGDIHS